MPVIANATRVRVEMESFQASLFSTPFGIVSPEKDCGASSPLRALGESLHVHENGSKPESDPTMGRFLAV